MKPWSLEATKNAVSARFGDSQAERLWDSLQSIHKRKYIAGYHFHEYKRLISEKLDPKLAVKHPLELMFAPDDDERQSIHTLRLQVVAHVLACMQSMHALGDTLAFAIAYSLGFNQGDNGLQDSKIGIDSVLQRLESDVLCHEIHRALRGIHTNSEFIYLADIVNHSKHRSVIAVDFHFDATGEASALYELRVPAFSFKSRRYQQRDVASLLEPLYAWLSPEIVQCGHALNTTLGASQA